MVNTDNVKLLGALSILQETCCKYKSCTDCPLSYKAKDNFDYCAVTGTEYPAVFNLNYKALFWEGEKVIKIAKD